MDKHQIKLFQSKKTDNWATPQWLFDKLNDEFDFDFYKYKGKQRTNKIARNLVDYEAGKTIFETVCGIVKKENVKQTELF